MSSYDIIIFPEPFEVNRNILVQKNSSEIEYTINGETDRISLTGTCAFFFADKIPLCKKFMFGDETISFSIPIMGVVVSLEFYVKEEGEENEKAQGLTIPGTIYLGSDRYNLLTINFTKQLGFTRPVKNMTVGFRILSIKNQCDIELPTRGDINLRLEWV